MVTFSAVPGSSSGSASEVLILFPYWFLLLVSSTGRFPCTISISLESTFCLKSLLDGFLSKFLNTWMHTAIEEEVLYIDPPLLGWVSNTSDLSKIT